MSTPSPRRPPSALPPLRPLLSGSPPQILRARQPPVPHHLPALPQWSLPRSFDNHPRRPHAQPGSNCGRLPDRPPRASRPGLSRHCLLRQLRRRTRSPEATVHRPPAGDGAAATMPTCCWQNRRKLRQQKRRLRRPLRLPESPQRGRLALPPPPWRRVTAGGGRVPLSSEPRACRLRPGRPPPRLSLCVLHDVWLVFVVQQPLSDRRQGPPPAGSVPEWILRATTATVVPRMFCRGRPPRRTSLTTRFFGL